MIFIPNQLGLDFGFIEVDAYANFDDDADLNECRCCDSDRIDSIPTMQTEHSWL